MEIRSLEAAPQIFKFPACRGIAPNYRHNDGTRRVVTEKGLTDVQTRRSFRDRFHATRTVCLLKVGAL